WDQPIFGQPMLLVPGWSQNRHAFTCGDFVKHLLAYGADIHIVELRGHGLSNQQLQIDRGLHPGDLDWDWDIDSYFLYDVPAAVAAASVAGRTRHNAAAMLRKVRFLARAANLLAAPGREFKPIHFNHVPVDAFLRALARAATESNLRRYELISRYIGSLLNPSRVTAEDFRWLLSQGGEKEPRRVVEQFARWIRHDEMKCYRTGYDYKAHFRDIAIPMAIFFGDLDKIASARSTRGIYRAARSEYLLWRPVKENSHLELTMGTDI